MKSHKFVARLTGIVMLRVIPEFQSCGLEFQEISEFDGVFASVVRLCINYWATWKNDANKLISKFVTNTVIC